tara:strand:+ start:35302 stop:35901 length:600 start_codon:yes stop_codon:yes gene_type:complete
MSMTTYDGLKASIANWLNRTDLTAEIPDFIELAENRIFHEVRIPTNEKTVLLTVNSEGYATLPSDFLELKDVFFNYEPLSRISLSDLYSYTPQSGKPAYFARETYRLKFFPTPTIGASDEMRMIYYYDVGRLSSTDTSNVMLSLAPELYLYGSLVEAANFLGSDSQKWEVGYQQAYARLTKHARDSEFSGATSQINSGY